MFTEEQIKKARCLSAKERKWMDEHPDNKDFGYTGPVDIDDTTEHEITQEDLDDRM